MKWIHQFRWVKVRLCRFKWNESTTFLAPMAHWCRWRILPVDCENVEQKPRLKLKLNKKGAFRIWSVWKWILKDTQRTLKDFGNNMNAIWWMWGLITNQIQLLLGTWKHWEKPRSLLGFGKSVSPIRTASPIYRRTHVRAWQLPNCQVAFAPVLHGHDSRMFPTFHVWLIRWCLLVVFNLSHLKIKINPLIWRSRGKSIPRSIWRCLKLNELYCLISQPYLSSDNRCPRWHHTPFPITICRDTQGQTRHFERTWNRLRSCNKSHGRRLKNEASWMFTQKATRVFTKEVQRRVKVLSRYCQGIVKCRLKVWM